MLRQFLKIFRYTELIKALVNRDLKVRYKNSILGYAWTWLDPLMSMFVFILIFEVILQFNIPNFPVYLLSALIPWTFFSNSISGSVGSITGNVSIIKRVYYPREIFPLTVMLSEGVNMFLGLLVLIPVILIFGIAITPKILLLPVPIVLLFVFTFGLCAACSLVNVFFRDMAYIIPFVLRLWFFMTPIFWDPVGRIPPEHLEKFMNIYMPLNPMAVVMALFRAALMGREIPGLHFVGAALFWCVLSVWLGYRVFKKNEDLMVKRI